MCVCACVWVIGGARCACVQCVCINHGAQALEDQKAHRYTLAFVCIFHRKGENANGFNIYYYIDIIVRQRNREREREIDRML